MFQCYNTSTLPSTEVAYHLMFISFCQAVIRENVFYLSHVLSRSKMQYIKILEKKKKKKKIKNAVSGRILHAFYHQVSFLCTSGINCCPDFVQWIPLMWTENDLRNVILVHYHYLKLILGALQLKCIKGNILKI